MRDPVIIELLGEPRAWQRAGLNRTTGAVYTPTAVTRYQGALKVAAAASMDGMPPFDVPLLVELAARMPIPSSWSQRKQRMALAGAIRPTSVPDLDNLMKQVGDALNGVAWRDDRLIVKATTEKLYSDRPALWISVRPFELAVVVDVRPTRATAPAPLFEGAPQ